MNRKSIEKSIGNSLLKLKLTTKDVLAHEIEKHINNLPDSEPIGIYCDDFLESYPEIDFELHVLIMNHRMKVQYND